MCLHTHLSGSQTLGHAWTLRKKAPSVLRSPAQKVVPLKMYIALSIKWQTTIDFRHSDLFGISDIKLALN